MFVLVCFSFFAGGMGEVQKMSKHTTLLSSFAHMLTMILDQVPLPRLNCSFYLHNLGKVLVSNPRQSSLPYCADEGCARRRLHEAGPGCL